MLIFIKILVLVYYLSVNFYGFLLIRYQKKQAIKQCEKELEQNDNSTLLSKENPSIKNNDNTQLQESDKQVSQEDKVANFNSKSNETCKNQDKKVTDGKLILTGVLGGALGIYLSMFVYKYRLTNFLLMVIMPLLITTSIYFIIYCFSNGFWLVAKG